MPDAHADPAPVRWDPALGGWLVTGHAAVRQVLRDARTFTVDDPRFSTARLTGPSMLTLDGAEHARHRRAFAAAFRPADVRRDLGARTRDLAVALVRDRVHRDELEVRSELAEPLSIDVLRTVLGLQQVPAATVQHWYRALTDAFAEDACTATGSAVRAPVVPEIGAALHGLPRPVGLSLDEYVGNVCIMLLGGIETVEGMICHAAAHRYGRDVAARRYGGDAATAELGAGGIDDFIEESLRLEPPAVRLDRYATSATSVAGQAILAGDLVVLALGAANLDESVFPDAAELDPGRAGLHRHLSFAIGPHYCLGVHVARLETREALLAIDAALPGAHVDPTRSDPTVGDIFRKPFRLTLVTA